MCDLDKLIQKLSPVARRQRLLVTHRTLDPMIPVVLVRRQIERLKSAGLQIEWHEFVKPHTIAGETELTVIRDFIKPAMSPDSVGASGWLPGCADYLASELRRTGYSAMFCANGRVAEWLRHLSRNQA